MFYNKELDLCSGLPKNEKRMRKLEAQEQFSVSVQQYGNSFSTSPLAFFFMILALCMYCTFIYMVINVSLFLPGTPFLQYVILMTWLVIQSICVFNFFNWSGPEKISVTFIFLLYFAVIMTCLPTTQNHRDSTLTQGKVVGLNLIQELSKLGASSLSCHADLKAIQALDCFKHEDRCKEVNLRAQNTTKIFDQAISTVLEQVPGERRAGIVGLPDFFVKQVEEDTGYFRLLDGVNQLPQLRNESIVTLHNTRKIPLCLLNIATFMSVEKTSLKRSNDYALTLYGINAMKQFGNNIRNMMIFGQVSRMLPDKRMAEMMRDTVDTLLFCFCVLDQGVQLIVKMYIPSENEYPVVAVNLCEIMYCSENKIYFTWNNHVDIHSILDVSEKYDQVPIYHHNTLLQEFKLRKQELDSVVTSVVVDVIGVMTKLTTTERETSVNVLECHSVRQPKIQPEVTVVNQNVAQNSVKSFDAEQKDSFSSTSSYVFQFLVDPLAFYLDVVEPSVPHASGIDTDEDSNKSNENQNVTNQTVTPHDEVICHDQNVSVRTVTNDTVHTVKISVSMISSCVAAVVFVAFFWIFLLLLTECITFLANGWVRIMELKDDLQEPLSVFFHDYKNCIRFFSTACAFSVVIHYLTFYE